MTAVALQPMSASQILKLDFGDAVDTLLAHDDLDGLVESDPAVTQHMAQRARSLAHLAFVLKNEAAMEIAHQSLFACYEQHVMLPDRVVARNQFHPLIVTLQHEFERKWEAYEVVRCGLRVDSVPASEDKFLRFFDHLVLQHRATAHPVYDFLRDEATRDQIVQYFTWDAPRQELAANLLDETGAGDDNARTLLFKETLDFVGRRYDPLAAGSALLAGHNLLLNLALNRRNHFRLVGALSATRKVDPLNHVKLREGCSRVGLTDGSTLAYYSPRIIEEVERGASWTGRLILPALAKRPDAAYEVMLGALMRLNTAAAYYDALLEQFRRPPQTGAGACR